MKALKRFPWAKLPLVALLLLTIAAIAAAPSGRTKWESERQACDRLAPQYQAETEAVLPDGCRVDLLSDTEAIEVDWAKKWAESIGQSLYYSIVTERTPGIVLLIRTPRDHRYVERCRKVCLQHGIALHIEQAQPLREPTLAPGPEPYTPTAAIGPPTHKPGDVVAWRSDGELLRGLVLVVQWRGGEWWYLVGSDSRRVVRVPESVLVATGGQLCSAAPPGRGWV